jgi:3-deoxy-D-manno-octulosonic acid (KDO) 8-phosphate synthase
MKVTEKLSIPYVFKACFDKANRSSINSYCGPGMKEGLKFFQEIKETYGVPIITDVHELYQTVPVAEVVDMVGMDDMKVEALVIFDATHVLQRPGGRTDSAGGRRAQAFQLARSGMELGIAGLFLEAHPNPNEAKCDGACALPLDKLEPYLAQMKAVDDLVKSFDPVIID